MKNDINLKRVRFLESERLFITPATMDDFDDHYRWEHDREMVFLDDEYFRPKYYENAREKFQEKLKAESMMILAIVLKDSGELAGLVMLYDIDKYERKCFWGLVLDRKFWRQGFGTVVAGLMVRYVFEDMGFRRLKSFTHSGNPGSMKFQEKLGFVKEAVLRKEYFFGGKYVDGIDYGMLREDFEKAFR